MKRLFASCIIAIAACMAWATNVIVDGTHVRLRTSPAITENNIVTDTQGKPVYPDKGASLTYIATKGNFYKVMFNGQEVYISRDYCHLSDTKAATTKAASGKLTAMDRKLVGKHLLSLQWISWDYFGSCNITKEGENNYRCVGEQLDRNNKGDYVKIDGFITATDELNLVFTGTIKMKIYHINGGEEYVREGTFNFKSTQGRKYWRMQEMDGPDGEVDYIDIYMKRNTK